MDQRPLTILIVNENAEARTLLARLMPFHGLVPVAEVATVADAVAAFARHRPDVVLLDLDIVGTGGLSATARITAQFPESVVVVTAVSDDIDTIRRAMLAGARAYLTRPFAGDELGAVVRGAWERELRRQSGRADAAERHVAELSRAARGAVVAVYSPTGGVGRTTIAINLAILGARRGRPTILADMDFRFGDVRTLLDFEVGAPSIGELWVTDTVGGAPPDGQAASDEPVVEHDILRKILQRHASGAHVLLAPVGLVDADRIGPVEVAATIDALSAAGDVIVDLPATLDPSVRAVLQRADRIIVPMDLAVTSVRAVRLFLDLVTAMGDDVDRFVVIANRAGAPFQLDRTQVAAWIERPVSFAIAYEPLAAADGNRGVPIVAGRPRSAFAADLRTLLEHVLPQAPDATVTNQTVIVPPILERFRQAFGGSFPN